MSKDTIYREDAIEAVERAATKEAARWSVKELPAAETNIVTVTIDLDEKRLNEIVEEAGRRLAVEAEDAEPKWIPCGERLPDECGDYLVTKETTGWNTLPYRAVDIAYFDSGCVWHKSSKVLAWMPLPDPYWEDERCADTHGGEAESIE